MEVSSLLLLPKVATAGKSVWMVNLLSSELGSLLRHGNEPLLYPSPFAIVHSNPAVKQCTLTSFCHPEVNDLISKIIVRG